MVNRIVNWTTPQGFVTPEGQAFDDWLSVGGKLSNLHTFTFLEFPATTLTRIILATAPTSLKRLDILNRGEAGDAFKAALEYIAPWIEHITVSETIFTTEEEDDDGGGIALGQAPVLNMLRSIRGGLPKLHTFVYKTDGGRINLSQEPLRTSLPNAPNLRHLTVPDYTLGR
jgi:hypothetical protein